MFTAPERRGQTGDTPEQSHQDGCRLEHTTQPRKGWVNWDCLGQWSLGRGEPNSVRHYLGGVMAKVMLLGGAQWKDERQQSQTATRRILTEQTEKFIHGDIKKKFFTRGSAAEETAQRGGGTVFLRCLENSTTCSPEQPDLTLGLALLQGEAGPDDSRVPATFFLWECLEPCSLFMAFFPCVLTLTCTKSSNSTGVGGNDTTLYSVYYSNILTTSRLLRRQAIQPGAGKKPTMTSRATVCRENPKQQQQNPS